MDGMQAAVILAKMAIFPDEVTKRSEFGANYSALLADTACVTPRVAPDNLSVYAQYTLQVERRDDVQQALKDEDIPSAVYYPVTLDRQPALADCSRVSGSLAVSHRLADKVMSLPMHPYLDQTAQEKITGIVAAIVGN